MRPVRNKKKEEGFTLIELIVVVAILGFLMAIAIPRYMSAREMAAANATKANLHSLASALEVYLAENPDATLPGTDGDFWNVIASYVPKKPIPPKTAGGTEYVYKPKEDTPGGYIIYDPNKYTIAGEGPKYFWIEEGGVIQEGDALPGGQQEPEGGQ
jgi:type II secretion system protein G